MTSQQITPDQQTAISEIDLLRKTLDSRPDLKMIVKKAIQFEGSVEVRHLRSIAHGNSALKSNGTPLNSEELKKLCATLAKEYSKSFLFLDSVLIITDPALLEVEL